MGIRLKEDVNGSANFSRQFLRKQQLGCSIGLVFEPNVRRSSFGLSGAERLYWGNQAGWLHWCWMDAVALLASLSGPLPLCKVVPRLAGTSSIRHSKITLCSTRVIFSPAYSFSFPLPAPCWAAPLFTLASISPGQSSRPPDLNFIHPPSL